MRRFILLAALALPTYAYACPHTQDLVVADSKTGNVVMVVIPDCDSQLRDPAWNVPGTIQVKILHSGQDPIKAAASVAAADASVKVTIQLQPSAPQVDEAIPVDATPIDAAPAVLP